MSIKAKLSSLVLGVAVLAVAFSASAATYTFNTNLKLGSKGEDVKNLQVVLNSDSATQVATTGAGSPGMESTYFGSKTKAAVIKYQKANGITPAVGYVGPITRAKLNGAVVVVPGTPTPVGGGIAVSSPTQPANGAFVENAARVPFTKVTLIAGTSDVAVNGIKVERVGLSQDAIFSGVVLLDEMGQQIGTSKTFNSLHQATVGEPMIVKAGTSKTYTIAGNAIAVLDAYAGQVAYLSVVGLDTVSTVSGTFPVTGAGHQVQATTVIGSVTSFVKGPLDPNSNVTLNKEVGTTGYTYAAIKFSAGSAEKIRVRSIRWNQSGSAAPSDVSNVMTYVDGVAYATTVSSDGKYFTSTFGDGIVVDKGNSMEISVKADILSGSGRTVKFDIYKNTDLYVTGEDFGYGLLPPTSGSAGLFGSTNPWYSATTIQVSAGNVTVSKATTVAADNIAVGVNSQTLGGFQVETKGEAVSVSSLTFQLNQFAGTGGAASTQDITNISLVDENGSVVAGPVDIAATSPVVTFSSSVTFPIGKKVYKLVGKLGNDFTTNDIIAASTTPSTWGSPIGQTTGNSITLASGVITGNTMTVKDAALVVSLSGTPSAQTVVAGKQAFTFANIQLNTTASGEDVKVGSFPLSYAFDGEANFLSGCQLFDGTTALNTGSNIPTFTAAGNQTFTLDAPYSLAKGLIKTVAVKCNLSGSATSSSSYKIGTQAASAYSVTGAVSGKTVVATGALNAGQLMTVGTGSLRVATESALNYGLVNAGASGVTLAKFLVNADNDAISLNRMALQLTTNASSSAEDISMLYLYNGSTMVGSGQFTSGATTTTINVSGVVVPKDGSVTLTLKADLASIDTSSAATREGSYIAVDFDGNGMAGTTYGIGESGTQVTTLLAGSPDTATAGVRMFKSTPTFAVVSGTATKLTNGTNSLYRFSVSAPAGGNGIGLGKIAVNVATSSGSAVSGTTTITALNVYGYTNSTFSSEVAGYTSGLVGTVASVNSGSNTVAISPVLKVPAGETYYFDVKGEATIEAGSGTQSGYAKVKILGDSAYPSLATKMDVYGAGLGNLVWSPNATTSSLTTHADWTNGYGVTGLPAAGTTEVTTSI